MGPVTDETDLGPCCICERPRAVVILMLNAQAPIAGHGWGCVQCGIGSHGAIAVVCPACAAPFEASSVPLDIEDHLRFVCRGYPGSEGRMPIEALRGEHGHDWGKHPEATQIPPLTVASTDTRFGTHVEEGHGCHCSRCGQTIWEGTIAIRAFAESGHWQYRYHGTCFGALPVYENAYEEPDAFYDNELTQHEPLADDVP
jgi:hypothetical protein